MVLRRPSQLDFLFVSFDSFRKKINLSNINYNMLVNVLNDFFLFSSGEIIRQITKLYPTTSSQNLKRAKVIWLKVTRSDDQILFILFKLFTMA